MHKQSISRLNALSSLEQPPARWEWLLVLPVADWFMNTSDLQRGLFGHLFNGDDETRVKPELTPLIARFRSGATQEQRVTLDGPQLDAAKQKALLASLQPQAGA